MGFQEGAGKVVWQSDEDFFTWFDSVVDGGKTSPFFPL